MTGGHARRRRVNALMFALTALCAAVSAGVLFAILGYIAWKGASSLSWAFLTRLPAPVGETGGGIANSIVGSAEVVGLAGLIGVPVGVLAGVYLSEFGGRGRLAFWVRYAADTLNGVPSIVVGLFAYALVVLPMRRFSALSGAVALAIIVVPIVLRNTEEFLRLVPGTIREAALALGVPRWKVTLRVVLPTARRGILTGALLALARAAGETAPLIFTAFGNSFWGRSLLQPVATLPLTLYNYAISPYDDWHRQAWAAALILMLFVLAVNAAARVWLKPVSGGAS
ncbi:MAG: phosphate ABC transporter permease PstA [Elusimicrobia bacterium]|nr:phosphate ABC transporter permease PstA [Elusimicrobiota bacterium]